MATMPADRVDPPATGRQRLAALLLLLLAAAMLATGILAIGRLPVYQAALDLAGGVLLVGAAALVARGRARPLAVALIWLSVLGIIAQLGGYQARRNDTGAFAATNTIYFLPSLAWPFMFGLIAVAIAATMLSKSRTVR